MNILVSSQHHHFLNSVRGKITLILTATLIVIFLTCSSSPSSKIAYKSYWIEINKVDLDKPALNSHVSVLRYHVRKTHAIDVEQRINSQLKLSNRQLIAYLNEIAGIYEEHHFAQHPRRGVLNPS